MCLTGSYCHHTPPLGVLFQGQNRRSTPRLGGKQTGGHFWQALWFNSIIVVMHFFHEVRHVVARHQRHCAATPSCSCEPGTVRTSFPAGTRLKERILAQEARRAKTTTTTTKHNNKQQLQTTTTTNNNKLQLQTTNNNNYKQQQTTTTDNKQQLQTTTNNNNYKQQQTTNNNYKQQTTTTNNNYNNNNKQQTTTTTNNNKQLQLQTPKQK